MKRIAIITTHPIQYYAPLYKLLAERKNIELKVFYTWGEGAKNNVFDPGFGKQREWDIPLLEGYAYEFVKNISKSPAPLMLHCITAFCTNPVITHPIMKASTLPFIVTLYLLK